MSTYLLPFCDPLQWPVSGFQFFSWVCPSELRIGTLIPKSNPSLKDFLALPPKFPLINGRATAKLIAFLFFSSQAQGKTRVRAKRVKGGTCLKLGSPESNHLSHHGRATLSERDVAEPPPALAACLCLLHRLRRALAIKNSAGGRNRETVSTVRAQICSFQRKKAPDVFFFSTMLIGYCILFDERNCEPGTVAPKNLLLRPNETLLDTSMCSHHTASRSSHRIAFLSNPEPSLPRRLFP